jgi:hypothetical protein
MLVDAQKLSDHANQSPAKVTFKYSNHKIVEVTNVFQRRHMGCTRILLNLLLCDKSVVQRESTRSIYPFTVSRRRTGIGFLLDYPFRESHGMPSACQQWAFFRATTTV